MDLFIVASEEEAAQVGALETHLAASVRTAGVRIGTSAAIPAGEDRAAMLRRSIRECSVLVLLITASLLGSEEGEAAIDEALSSPAQVMPVLLRACSWKLTVLAKLQWLPRDLVPIAPRPHPDDAWVEVVEAALDAVALRAPPASSEVRVLNEVHVLEGKLQLARNRREKLGLVGGPAAAIRSLDAEILGLRRQLRERGQLAAGDALADGRYVLLELLGKGGFATVWKAHDDEANNEVAIKVLHPQLARDETRRERFFRGARVMASLKHPAIVRVLREQGHDRGFDYFIMELVRGGTLRDAVIEGRVSGNSIPEILLHVGRALAAAHAQGHVHRDVKPANILLDEQDNPKLTDFDLVGGAHTTGGTRTGALGTFIYAAPEAMDKPQDAGVRADVYSLGMTALFCYYGKDLPHLVMRDAGRVIRGLACSSGVQLALLKATEWEIEARFSDVDAFCEALEPREPLASWAVAQGKDRFGRFARFAVGGVMQQMRWVPPGSFKMGSPWAEAGRGDSEGPQHEVDFRRGFWLADTPCTQALWWAVMENNPSRFISPNRPVEQVSWHDCQAFLAKLKTLVPGLEPRLPSEAEWEYACRAGTETATWAGDLTILSKHNAPLLDAIAWYTGNSGCGFELSNGEDSSQWPDKQYVHTRAGTRPVGQKMPNPLGLYDMLGNVLEWTGDWSGPYAYAKTIEPTGPAAGSYRVIRGGGWGSNARGVRAAYRRAHLPDNRISDVGFRIAISQ